MPNEPIILAAVDLDRRAIPVIDHAARLAALCHGHLTLVHVVDYTGGYESDHPFPQRPGRVLDDMVRHARASLVGMASHLDLPTDWAKFRVETGPVVETLARLADMLKPRYCVVGQSRLGVMSANAGLAAAMKERANCEVLAVPGLGEEQHQGMLARMRQWLGGDLGTPTSHPR
jgi:nucleotide-binding universal stress UspA family protein